MNRQDRILVIVDYQNVRYQAGGLNILPDKLFQALWERAQRVKGFVIDIRLFVPIFQGLAPWNELNALSLRYGFSIEACPFLREGRSRKDVVDFIVFRWLNTYASQADTIVLVTGDGDFIIAATMLKMQGKEVEIWSFATDMTSDTLFVAAQPRILQITQEVRSVSRLNRYALAAQVLLEGKNISPPELKLLDQLILAGRFLVGQQKGGEREKDTTNALAAKLGVNNTDARDLLNTVEGLGIQQSPDSLIALETALELQKGES
ncbi:MAG: NYN domain-containing protein [bacterium]|nr:NYN domain-containing protein [bacterium]